MRIMVLSADYPRFLRDLYTSRPGLAERSYAEQMAARNDSLFGVADFYSRNFKAHGHAAAEFHINNPWMQYAWARENGLDILPLEPPPGSVHQADVPAAPPARARQLLGTAKAVLRPARRALGPLATPIVNRVRAWRRDRLARQRHEEMPRYAPDRTQWEHTILRAQIEHFRPDLILNQELAYLRSPFFKTGKPVGTLLFGQIASSMPEDDSFAPYDLMISSLPNQVEWFRGRGLRAELNRLACEPSVLERMGPPPASRDIALSFVGSLSPDHQSRIAFLEYLATRTPLKVWGNGIERLPAGSPLHRVYQGEAWGRQMYDIIRRSHLTLNFHIDLAEGWANNLRLYEATLMGTALLTDWKKNLHEMFVPGEHVAAYTDAADCVRQIECLLADEPMRARIAAAGQAHALATQTYFQCTGEIAALARSLA